MSTATAPRERLKQIEQELSAEREELVATRRRFEQIKDEFARSADQRPGTPKYRASEAARADVAESERRITGLQEEQVALLKQVGSHSGIRRGGGNGPVAGEYGGGTWAAVAREFDLENGRTRVDTRLAGLLAAGVKVTPSSDLTAPSYIVPGGVAALARDERFLHAAFPLIEVESDELAVTDWTQTGERTVSGEVERDPLDTEAKATLALDVTLATPSLKQLALVIEKVPSKLIESIDAFAAFLTDEAAFQLKLATSGLARAQITAAKPPSGLEGEHLWQQVRNAVKAMRASGASPRVLAVSPEDAATLDLMTAGADEMPVFPLGAVGGASPLFDLTIIEVPGIEAPTLIDPAVAGVLFAGGARLLLDPYTGMGTNEVRLRVEYEALLHIRDPHGLYLIEGEGEGE